MDNRVRRLASWDAGGKGRGIMTEMTRTGRALGALALAAVVAAGCGNTPAEVEAAPNVVEVAQAVNAQSGEFSVLIAALVRADLAGELTGAGPFTVFAPTDAAFAALGLDAAAVSAMAPADLTPILLNHVTAGRLLAADVLQRTSLSMVGGGSTRIRLEGGAPFINDSRIVNTDIQASNGVIHVIDAVLLP
jgi:transforming growth factor-beta-induced protein